MTHPKIVCLSQEQYFALLGEIDCWTGDQSILGLLQLALSVLLSGFIPYDSIIRIIAQVREHSTDAEFQQIETILQKVLKFSGVEDDKINEDLSILQRNGNSSRGILPLCGEDLQLIYAAATCGAAAAARDAAVARGAAAAAPQDIGALLTELCKLEKGPGVFCRPTSHQIGDLAQLYEIVQYETISCKSTPDSTDLPSCASSHLTDAIEFLRRAGLMP